MAEVTGETQEEKQRLRAGLSCLDIQPSQEARKEQVECQLHGVKGAYLSLEFDS